MVQGCVRLLFIRYYILFSGKQESAEKRFENISSRHQESLKKHMTNYEDYESSEDEEELNDDGILQKLLNSYPGQSGIALA